MSGLPAWANAGDIERLREAIVRFEASAERSSTTLVRLTRILVGLTIAIALLAAATVALTVVLVVTA